MLAQCHVFAAGSESCNSRESQASLFRKLHLARGLVAIDVTVPSEILLRVHLTIKTIQTEAATVEVANVKLWSLCWNAFKLFIRSMSNAVNK